MHLSPLLEGLDPSFDKKKTWIPFTREYFVPSLAEVGPVVLEKILKSFECIFTISHIISPLRRMNVAFHLNKFECPSFKNALCHVWLKLDQWFWRRGFLKFRMYFYYFTIISPLRRAQPFIWTNFNLLHLRMFFTMFGWNWPSGSGEDF